MNLFRLCGDVSHVVSIVVLALRLNATKSAVGISLKTQELYLIVFVARYADLFSHFYSYYNTLMKIAFITSTAAIIYTVRFRAPWKHKYDRSHDTFKPVHKSTSVSRDSRRWRGGKRDESKIDCA